MKFTAVGDALIQRRIPADYKGYDQLKPIIEQGDARFFNLETTLNYEGECFASQFSGGTYIRTNPEVLEDMKALGFNISNINNNHLMDFSYEGLYSTLKHMNASGLVHAGVGMNLAQAAAPKYLDTAKGRVAIISASSSFNPVMMAGYASERVKGRPGVNGIRVDETIVVTPENFENIKKIADETEINGPEKVWLSQGYRVALPDHLYDFKGIHFEKGDSNYIKTSVNKADMERIEKAIYEAKLQADYILVSIHSHQIVGTAETILPEFLKEFAHKCIDAGAHAIIGHGCHQLRPIEVYKERPIFYSLGDFILELYSVEFAPEEFYSKYGLTSKATMHELLKTRSKDFTIGLMAEKVMNQTIIPYWEMEDGKLTKLELYPVELIQDGNRSEEGLPLLSDNPEIFERLSKLSEPFGVKMQKKKNKIVCKF